MPEVCVFDLNGTLLSLSVLDPLFQKAFGTGDIRRTWFDQMLQLSLVANSTGEYREFSALGGAALDMVAERRRTILDPDDRQEILRGMRRLPPFPDVAPGLQRLREAGMRLAALTNSAPDAAQAQVAFAGLTEYFEQVLSVDAVRRFKPAPEPYRMAARELGVPLSEIRLVAAHAWDIAGAHHAGCATGFVARPEQVLNPLGPNPDLVGADLTEVAEKILARSA